MQKRVVWAGRPVHRCAGTMTLRRVVEIDGEACVREVLAPKLYRGYLGRSFGVVRPVYVV